MCLVGQFYPIGAQINVYFRDLHTSLDEKKLKKKTDIVQMHM